MSEDYRQLPPDLPVPVDDGAADHLEGLALPTLRLGSAQGGEVDLAELGAGLLVVYVYPHTGIPGEPLPAGWDDIPGARGCTPQNCAYRDAAAEFAALGAELAGLSTQDAGEQREFAAREHIGYPLLNDSGLALAERLTLPTFEVEGATLYRRLTFIAREGRIVKTFYPVFPPDSDSAQALGWLREHPGLPLPAPPLSDSVVQLRPWRGDDLAAVEAATSDPEIVRRNGVPEPFDARRWLEAMPGERARGEALRLLIADADDDEMLGALGLSGIDAERRSADLGYWILAGRRGDGIAGRAVGLLCEWAFAELGLAAIRARTDADNVPSRRLLERLGFRLEEVADLAGREQALYVLARPA
jgi:RimJ/RimL family protein N-acetyltransferase